MMIMNSVLTSVDLEAKLFRGFGDSSRLKILEALQNEPLSVGEIADKTGLSQPNTSSHLRCLHECGLLTAEQQGRCTIYRLSDDRVYELITLAKSLLTDVAHGVNECIRYNLPSDERPTMD